MRRKNASGVVEEWVLECSITKTEQLKLCLFLIFIQFLIGSLQMNPMKRWSVYFRSTSLFHFVIFYMSLCSGNIYNEGQKDGAKTRQWRLDRCPLFNCWQDDWAQWSTSGTDDSNDVKLQIKKADNVNWGIEQRNLLKCITLYVKAFKKNKKTMNSFGGTGHCVCKRFATYACLKVQISPMCAYLCHLLSGCGFLCRMQFHTWKRSVCTHVYT